MGTINANIKPGQRVTFIQHFSGSGNEVGTTLDHERGQFIQVRWDDGRVSWANRNQLEVR